MQFTLLLPLAFAGRSLLYFLLAGGSARQGANGFVAFSAVTRRPSLKRNSYCMNVKYEPDVLQGCSV